MIVRHLTGDPPELAARATRALSGPGPLLLADLVVAECVYVLEAFYEHPRARVAAAMRALLGLDAVLVVDEPLLLRALELYEWARIDFADAYLVACAESTGVGAVLSFDRSLDREGSVLRIEP